MTRQNLRDFIGNDIIGSISGIGTIHSVQKTKYLWVAYINAEDDPYDHLMAREERAKCVRENMGCHRICPVIDDNGEVISGGSRKELIKNLKNNHPSWWILYYVGWSA